MREQLALLPEYGVAHLRLTLAALLCGIAVSVPAGILATRIRWLEQPITTAAGVVQTVPSLALLAIMVPVLAAIDLPSIGFLPAFLGLVLYSMLPILRNTVTGIGGVDPAFIEAARGVGMTPRQELLRVVLPLAAPVIIAGIRTSAVWTVGMATLSTPVGATSLGNYIFSGLQTRNFAAVLVGCIASASLALVLDGLIRMIAAARERRRTLVFRTGLVFFAALCAITVFDPSRGLQKRDRDAITVGAKTFSEQYTLSEILAGRIEEQTGLSCRVLSSLGSTVVFDALVAGQIDFYVDYSGTIWSTILERSGNVSRADVLQEVETALREKYAVTLVAPLGFENAYALAMKRAHAEELGIRRVSDLARHSTKLSIGGDYEFFERVEWRKIQSVYSLTFAEHRSMDPSLMYQAVAQGDVDVISAFSTDGRIAALDLVVLEDDRGAIPPYDAIILASPAATERWPEAIAVLASLRGRIDSSKMRAMNRAVDQDGRTPQDVAAEFLRTLAP